MKHWSNDLFKKSLFIVHSPDLAPNDFLLFRLWRCIYVETFSRPLNNSKRFNHFSTTHYSRAFFPLLTNWWFIECFQSRELYLRNIVLLISRPIQSSDLKRFLILSHLLPITVSWVKGSSTISCLEQKVGIIASVLNFHLKTLWVSKTLCAKFF